MKARIPNLLIALAIFASVYQATATTVFPITTNLNLFEISDGIAFGGSNYLVGMEVGTNVVGQLISSNGMLFGSQIIVGSNPGSPLPSIGLAFGQTNYLLAWSDNSVSSGVDMFGQFISRNGAKVGSKFNLLSTTDYNSNGYGFQTQCALASDGTNFLTVWKDNNSGNFYGQIITPAGTLSGSEFLISDQMQNGKGAAATFGKTNYLVIWQSNNGSVGQMDQAYGEFVSQAGVPGSWFQIGQTPSVDQSQLGVAFDGTNYLAVWNWDAGPETDVSVTNWDLYGILVSQTGTFPGNELQLVTDPGSQELPSLAFDGLNYLLSWTDFHWNSDGSFNSTNDNIRFQFFNRSGSPAGPEFTVFPSQGTNRPLLALNGLLFDGTRYAMAGTLGTIAYTNGNFTGFLSSEVYGAFIPVQPPPPPFTVLHTFTGNDGANPYASLVLSSNTLYDTAASAGANGAGTVFAVNTGGTVFTNLYSFTAPSGANGIPPTGTNSDGANPYGGLTISSNILYGTANDGGTNGAGTIFAVNTNGTGFRVLHTFAAVAINLAGLYTNSDGAGPNGLFLSGNTLYGTTYTGGTNGNGTVFSINTSGAGFTILHNFTALFGTNNFVQTGTNSDGANPYDGLLLSGNTLYGTASAGGTNGYGTVFKLNTNGLGFTNLHNFTGSDDGGLPYAGLILSSNTLYGTAFFGGSTFSGTVFSVGTNGLGFAVVHDFTGGLDGANPAAGLILSSNILFGTAVNGGSDGNGTVFAVSANGTGFMVLHSFTGGSDGANPNAGLTSAGNVLFGTAESGGNGGSGTIFSIWLGPTVQFTANPTAGFAPLTVQFSSTNVDSQGNAITSWNWNFGDGSASTLQKPSHTYTMIGNFSPALTATNNLGVAEPGSGPAIVVGNPIFQFTASPSNGPPPLAVQFNSPSVDNFGNNIVSWNWNFGDGATSTLQNPSHIYTTVGTFLPALVATNINGIALAGVGPMVACSAQGQDLFVADIGSGNIYEFTPDGVQSTFASGLSSPFGIAVDSAGDLYVSCLTNGTPGNGYITKITPGGVQSTFASGLNEPEGLAVDSAGNLFVGDAGRSTIYKVTPGGVQSTFAHGPPVEEVEVQGLAFSSAGDLFESDAESGAIFEFTPGGTESGFFLTNTFYPGGLAFDTQGNLFEAESFGGDPGHIYKFTPGAVRSTFASGLTSPWGLACDRAGNLFVADGNIYKFTPGGVQSTFASGLSAHGLAFGSVPVSEPSVTIILSGTKVILTWPTNVTGLTLQSTTNLSPPIIWTTNAALPFVINGQSTVTNPISGKQMYYRLSQ